MTDLPAQDAHAPGDAGPAIVAIVGYRNGDDIAACLAALARLSDPAFAVSVCENGGPAAFAALAEKLGGLVAFDAAPPAIVEPRVTAARAGRLLPGGQPVRLFEANSNLGYAGGINVCIGQIGPAEPWSALWILNPDTQPHPDALAALKARARDGYSMVSCRLVFTATQRVQSYAGRWRPLMASGRNIGMNAPAEAEPDCVRVERAMNYISGASLFAAREAVEAIGKLDERYFLYCEEIDWCFRRGARRIGYAHGAIVLHAHGATIGSSSDRKARSALSVYLDERNRLLFTRRFYPLLYPLVALTALALTLQYVRAGAPRNFAVALSGWFAGLRGEEGLPARFAGGGGAP